MKLINNSNWKKNQSIDSTLCMMNHVSSICEPRYDSNVCSTVGKQNEKKREKS